MARIPLLRRKDDGIPMTLARHVLSRDIPRHGHVGTELVYIQKGAGNQRINNECFACRPGDVFVIGSGCTHGFEGVKDLRVTNLSFDPVLFDGFDGDLRGLAGFQGLFVIVSRARSPFHARLWLSPADQVWFDHHLEVMGSEVRKKGPGFRAVLRADLIRAAAFLSRRYRFNPEQQPHSPNQVAAKAAVLMEDRHREEITSDMVAEHCGVSSRHLTRLFDLSYGVGPMAYLGELRLKHAADRLRDGKGTITQVALDCGFSDSNYFSRLFMKRFGLTPRRYRQGFGQDDRLSHPPGAAVIPTGSFRQDDRLSHPPGAAVIPTGSPFGRG